MDSDASSDAEGTGVDGQSFFASSVDVPLRRRDRHQDLCDSLQSDDASTTEVVLDSSTAPTALSVYRLGHALLKNTQVDVLKIYIVDLVASLANVSRGSDSSRDGMRDTLDPLLQLLQKSKSLKHVHFLQQDEDYPRDNSDMRYVCYKILRALAKNPSIVYVECHAWMPPNSMALLSQAASLSGMTINTHFFDEDDDEVHDELAQGLVACSNLQTLELVEVNETWMVDSMFGQLAVHPKLKRIQLEPILDELRTPPESLATLVQTTKSIQHVHLSQYGLESKQWKQLREALQLNPIVTRLCLENCVLDARATTDFIKALEPLPKSRPKRFGPMIHSLHIDVSLSYKTFRQLSFAVGMAKIMTTWGTPLQELYIQGLKEYPRDDDRIFKAILDPKVTEHRHIQIPKLRLDVLMGCDARAFARCLERTSQLRDLQISFVDESVDVARILKAVLRNGSLTRASFGGTRRKSQFLSATNRRKVRAYCDRNRLLPGLLANPASVDPESHGVAMASRQQLALFPHLMEAGQQTARTGFGNLLIGLMATSGTSLGPSHVALKRHHRA